MQHKYQVYLQEYSTFSLSTVKGVKQVQSNEKELRRKNMEGGLEEGGGDIYEDGLMFSFYRVSQKKCVLDILSGV